MARLSHGMTEDEVRDEYEWMVSFMAAMAESIRGTKDVHSLAAYVRKLERENAELRERVKGFLGQRDERLAAAETRCNELMDLVRDLMHCPVDLYHCETCEHAEVTPKSVTGNWDRYECKPRNKARELVECHDVDRRMDAVTCSACKATVLLEFGESGEPTYSVDGVADVPKYCPNCGRRFTDETCE